MRVNTVVETTGGGAKNMSASFRAANASRDDDFAAYS
jgi:hypothetical protein